MLTRPSCRTFALTVNGIMYEHYEQRAISFNAEAGGEQLLKGYLHVNRQSVFD